MTTPEPTPPPENAPGAKETAQEPQTPNLLELLSSLGSLFKGSKGASATIAVTPGAPAVAAPRWLIIFAMLCRLIWPLAIFGGGIALFISFGATGWLWLVILLVIVCAILARPPQPPAAA